MPDMDLLGIFGNDTDELDYASGSDDWAIRNPPSWLELVKSLTWLVEKHYTFRRCYFISHGRPGSLRFSNFAITGFNGLSSKGVYKLFSRVDTTIEFLGCNVAEGEQGWKFLEEAAQTFLISSGGFVRGWDSVGFSLLGSHIYHPWGDRKTVWVKGGEAYRIKPSQNAHFQWPGL